MGLKLRYNLFYEVQAKDVYGMYREFYGNCGRTLLFKGCERDEISIYHPQNQWVVVELGSGWEWKERREVQLLVSYRLCCPGFLAFVYDGDYWGYKFFVNGIALDHFVQDPDECGYWFPGKLCMGDAEILVAHLPQLDRNSLAAYLVQKPAPNVKAKPEDEFRRFDEFAVLDFLDSLGVPVSLQDGVVRVDSDIFKSFWLGQYVV